MSAVLGLGWIWTLQGFGREKSVRIEPSWGSLLCSQSAPLLCTPPGPCRDSSGSGKSVGFEIGPVLAHSIWEIIGESSGLRESLFYLVHKFGR